MEGLEDLPEDMVYSFQDVTQVLWDKVTAVIRQHQPTPQAEPRFIIPFFSWSGGCNDAFSGFGFLAFLLALLDLILELQNNGDGGGRRLSRDLGGWARDDRMQDKVPEWTVSSVSSTQEAATKAVYSMYRGFLNALASHDSECAKRFLCEGAEEAQATGPLGQMIAHVASVNAATWLTRENATRYKGVEKAGHVGAAGGMCATRFSQCFSLPNTYQYPRVYTGDPLWDYRTPGTHDDL